MANSGKNAKLMPFLGVFMSVLVAFLLLVVATEGAVTIYNPARIPAVSIGLEDGETVRVESGIMSIDVTEGEQSFTFTLPTGGVMSVNVKDGDVLILLPQDLFGSATASSARVIPFPGGGLDTTLSGIEPRPQP